MSARSPRRTTTARLGGLAAATVLLSVNLAPAAPAAPASGPGAASTASAAAGAPYHQVDLGTLGGGASFSIAMNDRGHVVGRAEVVDGTSHGFLWRSGTMTDLGLFTPTDINNRDQVIGTRDDAPGAWIWRAGRLAPLSGLAGWPGSPTALNDRGQVVGLGTEAQGRSVPALWSRGRARLLPLFSVSDINNRGQISGGRLTADRRFDHAAVWRRGQVTDLGAGAGGHSGTFRINSRGWVIGWVLDAQVHEHGSLWRRTGRTELVAVPAGGLTHPVAVNDRGTVLVLTGADEFTVRPALWRRGALTDLTAVGVPAGLEYVDLNDNGQIAGTARSSDGRSRATVWLR
jgi:probable HAF family extracellular repeat protein